jgi:virginiamycin B lyase
MKRAIGSLIVALVAVGCRPIDGNPVVRTEPSANTATPSAIATSPSTANPNASPPISPPTDTPFVLQEYPVTRGQGPHDVAPARDGGVWYTAQLSGELGWLDPKFGVTKAIKLGAGSAPHGVIVGPDGAPWVTDGGLNAIVRVDPVTSEVKRFPLPADRRNANLNTAVFDTDGRTLWFTGQSGVFGRLDTQTGAMAVFDAPRGAGPYGIASCPNGEIYYASLAGNYVGRIVKETGGATVLVPPTAGQGARRVWCDSKSRVWVSEWNAGQLARYDGTSWKEWKLPGNNPMAYAVFVDDADVVWVTDWGANGFARFDPVTETFAVRTHPSPNANVREILGRHAEVWGAMSGQDKLVVARPAG